MGRELRRQAPALIVACVALVAALGGTVYAAAKIDGRAIKVKSLPGNRLALASIPANRLKPGVLPAAGSSLAATGSIAGAQIDTATLGQVPSAVHADIADSARDAETALNAVNAIDAVRVNGHSAGCQTPDPPLRRRLLAERRQRGGGVGPGRGARLRHPGRRAAERAGAGRLLPATGDRAGAGRRVDGRPRQLFRP